MSRFIIDALRALPTYTHSEIDGEESDGTPQHWRSRPFVSLTKAERIVRAALPDACQSEGACHRPDSCGIAGRCLGPELPVAYLRSITHPDWLELCEKDEPGAFPVYATSHQEEARQPEPNASQEKPRPEPLSKVEREAFERWWRSVPGGSFGYPGAAVEAAWMARALYAGAEPHRQTGERTAMTTKPTPSQPKRDSLTECPPTAAPVVEAPDERAMFDRWVDIEAPSIHRHCVSFGDEQSMHINAKAIAWMAWKGRATTSTRKGAEDPEAHAVAPPANEVREWVQSFGADTGHFISAAACEDFATQLAAFLGGSLPCGHPASLMLKSAETGADLYCELCDAQSGRRDAETREQELSAALAATQPASKCDSLIQPPLHTDEAGEAKRLADDAKRLVRLCHGREDPFGAIDASIDRLAALASQTKGETEPAVGETWRILRRGAYACATLKICEVTPRTVSFESGTYGIPPECLPRESFEFVEKYHAALAQPKEAS